MRVITIASAETKDLLAFFNAHVTKTPDGKVINRFADRKSAEARTSKLVEYLGATVEEFYPLPKGFIVAPEGVEGEEIDEEATIEEESKTDDNGDAAPATKAAASAFGLLVQTVQKATEEAELNGVKPTIRSTSPKASNSDGVAASWADNEVRSSRLRRDGVSVSVDGGAPAQYKSTYEAFRDLRLPNNKHIRFRLRLKEAHRENGGSATFENNGKKYVFSIVPGEEMLLAETDASKKVKA
jgi:hypothetical protein